MSRPCRCGCFECTESVFRDRIVAGHLRGVDSREDAIAATAVSLTPRRPCLMETTRVNGVRGDAEAAPGVVRELGKYHVTPTGHAFSR